MLLKPPSARKGSPTASSIRVNMINGKTVEEATKMSYLNPKGCHVAYTLTDLKYDMKHDYIKLDSSEDSSPDVSVDAAPNAKRSKGKKAAVR